MPIVTEKINKMLKEKDISHKKIGELFKKSKSHISQILSGERSFPVKHIKKILPILEVSREEFDSWILSDKYLKEVLQRAIQVKKDFPYKKKSILTTNIDAILKEKSMSRTDLSKIIVYSQSGLNRMIIGEIGMSDSVRERVAKAFEISQNEVLAWIIADRHGLGLLEAAFRDTI